MLNLPFRKLLGADELIDKILPYIWGLVFLSQFTTIIIINEVSIGRWVFLGFLVLATIIDSKKLLFYANNTPIKYFGLLVLLSFIINGFYYIRLDNFSFMSSSILMTLLFLFTVISFTLLNGNKREKYIDIMVLASTIGMVISFILIICGMKKALFYNPNQMGRIALFFSSIVCVLYFSSKPVILYRLVPMIMGIGSAICIVTSKRAAILGFLALFLILLFKDLKIGLLSIVSCIIFIGIYFLTSELSTNQHLERMENRWRESDPEDSFIGRGLDRIIDNPKYVLVGSGDGGVDRFGSIFEIHATYANILFCYGILGLFLFTTYQYSFFKQNIQLIWFLLPIFIYTTLHNDMRSIYFLVLPLLFHKSTITIT